jgi:hypothetical protein
MSDNNQYIGDQVTYFKVKAYTDLVRVVDVAISFGNIKLGRHSKALDR